MAFATTFVDDVFITTVTSPRATVDIANKFKRELLQHLDNGSRHGVVDLSDTEFIDSAFLGALVTALKRATARDGDILLVGLQQPVKAMFELTRLHRIFQIHETTQSALKSLKP